MQRRDRRLNPALREPDECEAGLWWTTELVATTVGLLGPCVIAREGTQSR